MHSYDFFLSYTYTFVPCRGNISLVLEIKPRHHEGDPFIVTQDHILVSLLNLFAYTVLFLFYLFHLIYLFLYLFIYFCLGGSV